MIMFRRLFASLKGIVRLLAHTGDLYEQLVEIKNKLSEIDMSVQSISRQSQQRRWLEAGDLRAFERSVFSQNGEDGIIQEIFWRIGTETRYFVEFGVESGIECNCARLALQEQWSGLFIESNSIAFEKLVQRYRECKSIQCVSACVSSSNVEDLFAENQVPFDFDLLSVDIDGNDYWVWSAIKQWHPRIVVIEYNASFPPEKKWVMPENPHHTWDGTTYHGASLASLVSLGEEKGYTLVTTDSRGVNAFFVKQELVTDAKFLNPIAHYHYSPPTHGKYLGGHPPRSGPYIEK